MSPGSSVLVSADSQAPWPTMVSTTISSAPPKTSGNSSHTLSTSAMKSGSAKSMEGRRKASSTRSGIFVGPGFWTKYRPPTPRGPAVTVLPLSAGTSGRAQASSRAARDSTESMNSSMISYTTCALVFVWFMVPTIWPTK